MRSSSWWLCVMLAFAVREAPAQVEVQVTLARDSYLTGAPAPLTVRVINNSGETLHLAEGGHWLDIIVRGEHDKDIPRQGDISIPALDLQSAKAASVKIDMLPKFDLARVGRYTVTAQLDVKNWARKFTSDPAEFDVIAGTKLWAQDFGVARKSGTNDTEPEMRKYTLLQANFANQMRLYCRVSDAADAGIYRVFEVGPMTSFSRLDPRVDQRGILHLLYQNGARSYSYTETTPNGDVVVRQTYDYKDPGPPVMKADKAGHFSVEGGVRHLAPSDLPTPTEFIPYDDKEPAPVK